ncbi:hypothetical protein KTH73_04440 [Acinetobacter courvalinii]|uniref:hypothetical protein n=1 Tax=Acinetobacter courvalinii TaxID=280147 RepID=UPI0021CD9AD3|nr:hypothetical protein [Acinetobacter courvalinii]MCU4389975.1 hypothetical protein [Acinetobacter courvalinii]
MAYLWYGGQSYGQSPKLFKSSLIAGFLLSSNNNLIEFFIKNIILGFKGLEYLNWKVCLELFKALTPFILALIVYLIWHKQKEKEVVASEAKNALAIINSMLRIQYDLARIMDDIENAFYNQAFDESLVDKFTSKWTELDNKKGELYNSLLFICDANNDSDLQRDAINMYEKIVNQMRKLRLNYTVVNHKTPEAMAAVIADRISIEINLCTPMYKLKETMLGFALYRR